MILVTLSVTAPPGGREEMAEAFWSLLGPIAVEPGCRACGLYQEVGSGDVLLYVEEWETVDQLERHLRSCRYERLLALMEVSARPPVLRYHWVTTVKGLEYLEAVRLGEPASPSGPPSEHCHQEQPDQ